MKKCITLFFLITTLKSISQVNQGMPAIVDVINMFFTTYNIQNTEFTVVFQKKARGWYVAEFDYQTSSIKKAPQLFWDKSAQDYNQLNYADNIEDTASTKKIIDDYVASFADDFIQYASARCLFYGYDDWSKDIVDYAAKETNITDSLLECIGMAYSDLASNAIFLQLKTSNNDNAPSEEELNNNQPYTTTQINSFITYTNNSISTYDKLYRHDSNYQTKWGKIKVNLVNQKVFSYTILKFLGREEEGRHYLANIAYPDTILKKAKAIFNDTKQNGIIFTNSDDNLINAAMYLQASHFRPDILLVPYYLIGTKPIIRYLDKSEKHTLFVADSSIYLAPSFSMSVFYNGFGDEKAIPLDSFINRLYKSPSTREMSNGQTSSYYPDDNSFKYFTKNVYIKVNKSRAASFFNIQKVADIIKITVNNVLGNNDVLALYIIQKNFGRRHIYISFLPVNDTYKKYLKQHGVIWEFSPEIK